MAPRKQTDTHAQFFSHTFMEGAVAKECKQAHVPMQIPRWSKARVKHSTRHLSVKQWRGWIVLDGRQSSHTRKWCTWQSKVLGTLSFLHRVKNHFFVSRAGAAPSSEKNLKGQRRTKKLYIVENICIYLSIYVIDNF